MERQAYYSPFSTIEHESNPEKIFRASMGFDFIFNQNGSKRSIKCIEINGDDTGIYGISKITPANIDKSLRLIARIRAHNTPEVHFSNMKILKIYQLLENRNSTLSDTEKCVLRLEAYYLSKSRLFSNAYKNPNFINIITSCKENQPKVIPSRYKLRTFAPGRDYHPESNIWIIKPNKGSRGDGIFFLENDDVNIHYQNLSKNRYVIQEFIYPSGADNAPQELSGNAASMRYLIDYVCESGRITKTFEAAYMRVAPTSGSTNILSEDFRDSYIVNLARKAIPIPASVKELDMARQAASSILSVINSRYYEYMDAIASMRKTPEPAY